MKLSFKKQKRGTGLIGVGYPYPITDIKVDGKMIGSIVPPTWHTRDVWKIQIAVTKQDIMEDGNPNCIWRWMMLASDFESEKSAREYLKENKEALFTYNLHYFND